MVRRASLVLCACAVVASFAAALAAPGDDDRMIEDFESYKSGEVIGSSAKSTPWRRFGEATTDNLVATGREDRIISGYLSGQYSVAWPAKFGMVRYVMTDALDLTAAKAIVVKVRSDSEVETTTQVQLNLSNRRAAFETKKPIELNDDGTPKEIVFLIGPDRLDRVDGERTVTAKELLAGVTEIGLNFTSPRGDIYKETSLLDDRCVRGGR
jgi:hypothetical protein